MKTKAYFASSVPAALEFARRELGENALLVDSRPTLPHARQFGRLEVTFAWDPKEEPLPGVEPRQTQTPAETQSPEETGEIRRQLAAMRVAVGKRGQLPGVQVGGVPEEHSFLLAHSHDLAHRLLTAGFSPDFAADIASAAGSRSGNPDTAVIQELTSRIPTAPFMEMKPGESRTLAFIGPPGRGKTTSLVKIAVTFGLARRVPVRIYCGGAHSIGAREQMARFASILDIRWQACESLANLNVGLVGDGWKGLTLVDTPGISPADRNELGEIGSFLAAHADIEKHLVLRADASSADILHVLSRFSSLTPSRLLFTGMDEAIRTAHMIEALIRGGIPATFAGTGQQIPEDLEEVNAENLVRSLWAAAGAAAMLQSGGADVKFKQAAA